MKYAINHEFVSISSQTATHRIILMHGWGADSDDLLAFGKELTEKINLDFFSRFFFGFQILLFVLFVTLTPSRMWYAPTLDF